MIRFLRLSFLLQIALSLLILSTLNIVLLANTGYFENHEWNWDMERLLHFSHLNRLEQGLPIWEIKLQRLPGLFPLYLISTFIKNIFGDMPDVAVKVSVFASSLFIQFLVVCLALIVVPVRKTLATFPAIATFLMTIEILLSKLIPSFDSYINAAFRLSWHGDSSLINILLFYIIFTSLDSETAHRKHVKYVLLSALGLISFLGSLSSSLFVLIAVLPAAAVLALKLSKDQSLSPSSPGNFFNVLAKPQPLVKAILHQPNILIVCISSLLGLLFLKVLREGCTPTIIGDSSITRAAISGLLASGWPLSIPLSSMILWLFIYVVSLSSHSPLQKSAAAKLFALHMSIPALLFIYTFTSYGDLSVLYRYSGVFAFLMPLAVVVLAIGYCMQPIGFLLLSIFSGSVLLPVFKVLDLKKVAVESVYKNPLHISISKAFSPNGHSNNGKSRRISEVLVTDGVGHIATAPVLEFLSSGSIRFSQLAGIGDPRLFDQSPEEFVISKSRSKIWNSSLFPGDIRNYEYVVSTKKLMARQIDIFGLPRKVSPLWASESHEYVLLEYTSPSNHGLKTHFASYLNQHRDAACKSGVSWLEAMYRFAFAK